MASKRNAFSSLIDHGLDPDLFNGFHFLPTYEEGIRIVNIKNAGGELPPIFNEYGRLFQCQPEQLEECYCFTKLELLGKNKVNRALGDGSGRYWKNIKSEFVRADNNNVVTKLVLRKDKNTPTEWHILEYRDTEMPDADRWVLCQIYKREKNNDSGSSGRFDPHPSASDTGAGQIYPSTSQVSSMNQIPGVGQYEYPPPSDVDNNPQQFPSCTYSDGGIDTFSDFDTDDWNGFF